MGPFTTSRPYLLIAPIHRPGGEREVHLPAGTWRYWFDDAIAIEGPVEFSRNFPLDEYPVYVRKGAIIPMNISGTTPGSARRTRPGYSPSTLTPPRQRLHLATPRKTRRRWRSASRRRKRSSSVWRARAAHTFFGHFVSLPAEVSFNDAPVDAAAWNFRSGAPRNPAGSKRHHRHVAPAVSGRALI